MERALAAVIIILVLVGIGFLILRERQSTTNTTDDFALETEIGVGRVIEGWDRGVLGMKVGGKRRLIVPPSLAYGTSGVTGVIPPNATLMFELELLAIKEKELSPTPTEEESESPTPTPQEEN